MLQGNAIYEFGPFRLDTGERQLFREGTLVPLTPEVFDTLVAFVESPGKLLTKQDLIKDANLHQNVATLRTALEGIDAENQFIETVPEQGYRFIASVNRLAEPLVNPAATELSWGIFVIIATSILFGIALLAWVLYSSRPTAPTRHFKVSSPDILRFVKRIP